MKMMLNELAKEIHDIAISKGWWEQERNPLEIHALIHSEISEATEEVRNGKPHHYKVDGKPEGECVELADAIIRILDWCAYNEWDIDHVLREKIEFNKTRENRHGGKRY
jgi:NTP pyrophosphatase (non-canonical NTP hydrolase)